MSKVRAAPVALACGARRTVAPARNAAVLECLACFLFHQRVAPATKPNPETRADRSVSARHPTVMIRYW